MYPAIPLVSMVKLSVLLSKVVHHGYATFQPSHSLEDLASVILTLLLHQSPLAIPTHLDLSISGELSFEHHLFSVYIFSCDLIQPHGL